MKHTAIILASLVLLLGSLQAQTQVPSFLNYQGKVTDSAGAGLGSSSPINRKVIFRIYDAATGGNKQWTEEQTATFANGEFSVLLGNGIAPTGSAIGEIRPSLDTVFTTGSTDRYLEITVDNGDATITASDLPISPRQRISTTAYSFRARVADSLASGTPISSGNLTVTGTLAAGTMTGSSLNVATGAISGGSLSAGSGTISGGNLSVTNAIGGASVTVSGIVTAGTATMGTNGFATAGVVIAGGAISGASLAINNNGAISTGGTVSAGAFTTGGTVSAGAFTTGGTLNAGATTVGTLGAGSTTVSSLNAGGGNITTTGTVTGGALSTSGSLSAGPATVTSLSAGGGSISNTANIYTNGGKIGVGTTSPGFPLDVRGSVDALTAYTALALTDWGDADGALTLAISIKSANYIVAGGMAVSSDARIKKIIGLSDTLEDLATLGRIEITDYQMKDPQAKGKKAQKKVIAQQVEKVYPQAVSKTTDVVPDIYKKASTQDGWVELATDLKKGERVRLIAEKEEGIHEVLEVAAGRFRTAFQPEGMNVFVYGREVKDFRVVDYDAISMLNVSATQQLKKEKDAEVNALAAENAELRARLARLEARDKARDARLVNIEALLQGQDSALHTVSLKKNTGAE